MIGLTRYNFYNVIKDIEFTVIALLIERVVEFHNIFNTK
jgi:hypothetical protein